MSPAWVTIALLAAGTVAIKSAGPVALGGRPLPPRLVALIALLAPALLAALVVVDTVGGERRIVLDARLAGLLAAAVAIRLRLPVVVVVVVAAAATALVRAVG